VVGLFGYLAFIVMTHSQWNLLAGSLSGVRDHAAFRDQRHGRRAAEPAPRITARAVWVWAPVTGRPSGGCWCQPACPAS
jgi:hypothetical protein